MFFDVVVSFAVCWAAVHLARRAWGGPRWIFIAAATLSGAVGLVEVIGAVVAGTVGRGTWNGLVAGSSSSEALTLEALVIGFLLLISSCLLLLVGVMWRRHQLARIG